MPVLRIGTVLFSFCLHGGLAAALWVFSGEEPLAEEKVYHVALAQLAAPQQGGIPAAPASAGPAQPAQPEPPAPPPPASVQEPKPEAQRPAEPAPAVKPSRQVSPRKKKTPTRPAPASAPVESAPPRQTQPATGSVPPSGALGGVPGGGGSRQMGGNAVFGADQVDQRPAISRNSVPEYPKKARRMHVQGRTVVQILVDTSGAPRECSVVESDPPGYFEEVSLRAARAMRFVPGKIKGQPVHTLVMIPFVFRLH